MRGGQARRAGTDDGDSLFVDTLRRGDGLPLHVLHLIHHEALEGHDGNGLIHFVAGALVLAAVITDATTDSRERIVLFDDAVCLGVPFFADEGDVALGALVDGTGVAAGRRAPFLDGVGVGRGLGVELVDGLALHQPGVKEVGHLHRADLGAIATTGAFIQVHEAGALMHQRGEIARLATQFLQLGTGDDLDIQVAATFHQLGGHDAHGAVVGGESLVQLGHDAADGRLLLQQIDLEARLGQV